MHTSAIRPSSDSIAKVGKSKKNLLMVLMATLLGVSYVPLELPGGGASTSDITFIIVLALGIRYKVFNSRFGMVELAGFALATWLFARMCILAYFENFGVNLTSARDAMAVFAGLIAFRLARMQRFKRPIVQGVAIGLVLALVLEFYQLLSGLPRLLAEGYVAPTFNYNTAYGAYRPFGGFFTPVIFGTYLSMAILFISFTNRSKAYRLLAVVATFGLVLTYTRSAWIGLMVGCIAGLSALSTSERSRVTRFSVPVLWISAITLVSFPALIERPMARMLTVFDVNYESNSIRLDLWAGTFRAVQDMPLIGYGKAPFSETLSPYIGSLASFGHAHSTFGYILYTYGFIGLFLYLGILAALVGYLLQLKSKSYRHRSIGWSVFASFLVSSLAETTWGSFQLIVLLFLALGIASTKYDDCYTGEHGS